MKFQNAISFLLLLLLASFYFSLGSCVVLEGITVKAGEEKEVVAAADVQPSLYEDLTTRPWTYFPASNSREEHSDDDNLNSPPLLVNFVVKEAALELGLELDLEPESESKQKLFRRGGVQWTAEEEELLLRLREEQQMPWAEINEYFPDRSRHALRTRYYVISRDQPGKTRNKPWTDEEDELLLELATDNSLSWVETAEWFPERSPTAVKSHYGSLMRDVPLAKTFLTHYTAEEDKLLLELAETGMPWKERAKLFEDRTVKSLKSRYRKIVSSDKGPAAAEKKEEGRSGGAREHFTPEEDDLLVEALGNGMTRAEIAELLDRSELGVRNRINRLGESNRLDPTIPQVASGRHYTDADFQLMQELRSIQGMFWKDIAAQYFPGRSIKGVRSAFMGYQKRNQKQRGNEPE